MLIGKISEQEAMKIVISMKENSWGKEEAIESITNYKMEDLIDWDLCVVNDYIKNHLDSIEVITEDEKKIIVYKDYENMINDQTLKASRAESEKYFYFNRDMEIELEKKLPIAFLHVAEKLTLAWVYQEDRFKIFSYYTTGLLGEPITLACEMLSFMELPEPKIMAEYLIHQASKFRSFNRVSV